MGGNQELGDTSFPPLGGNFSPFVFLITPFELALN
jgi:hypothetical protein